MAEAATGPSPGGPPGAVPAGPVPQDPPAVDAGLLAQRLRQGRHRLAWGFSSWRMRALLLMAVAGGLALIAMGRWLAGTPTLDARWAQGEGQRLLLTDSADPALDSLRGQALVAVSIRDGASFAVDARLLQRWPRWQMDDSARGASIAQHLALARCLATGHIRLHFESGQVVEVPAIERGPERLGLLFGPLATLALLLALIAAVVVMARPQARTALFAAISLSQSASLLLIAVEGSDGLGLPEPGWLGNLPLRATLDLCTGAAIVHGFALHPRRLLQAPRIALLAWSVAPAWLLLVLAGGAVAVHGGWLAQAGCLALGLAATAVIHHTYRLSRDAYARVMQRFAVGSVAALVVATLATALAGRMAPGGTDMTGWASTAWHLFFASVLLLVPWLSRGRRLMREFSMTAGTGILASALVVMLMSALSIGIFSALALASVIALGLYCAARLWFLKHLIGHRTLPTERTFEQLYRAAREVQARPQKYPQLLAELLRELFEPLEVLSVERVPVRSRVIGGGSALLVPLRSSEDDGQPAGAMALRYAQQGERLFTLDDARLADRVIDQLRRAVAYDQAVERGRTEERLRIAQDLHDDIGARLLTLMYQAPTPELEEYIRHTLKDLKTLTRGLAATEHRFSHAAAEWKADLTQRLTVAHVGLGWSVEFDADPVLTVVQWSALTRVLRELVTNALYHGHAARIEIAFVLLGPVLELRVADDGQGRHPESWAHGLGLGGVRKRVKLMGGEVVWRECDPCGIVCSMRIPEFASGP